MILLAIALLRVFVYQFTSKYSYSQDARAYTHTHTQTLHTHARTCACACVRTHTHTQASTPPSLLHPLIPLAHPYTHKHTYTYTQTPTFTTDYRFIRIMNRMQQSIAAQCNRCVQHNATDRCDAIPATPTLFSTIAPENYCNTLQQITATQGIQ